MTSSTARRRRRRSRPQGHHGCERSKIDGARGLLRRHGRPRAPEIEPKYANAAMDPKNRTLPEPGLGFSVGLRSAEGAPWYREREYEEVSGRG